MKTLPQKKLPLLWKQRLWIRATFRSLREHPPSIRSGPAVGA
jgi:hypothetical protein